MNKLAIGGGGKGGNYRVGYPWWWALADDSDTTVEVTDKLYGMIENWKYMDPLDRTLAGVIADFVDDNPEEFVGPDEARQKMVAFFRDIFGGANFT